jgi:hypothetical protein
LVTITWINVRWKFTPWNRKGSRCCAFRVTEMKRRIEIAKLLCWQSSNVQQETLCYLFQNAIASLITASSPFMGRWRSQGRFKQAYDVANATVTQGH